MLTEMPTLTSFCDQRQHLITLSIRTALVFCVRRSTQSSRSGLPISPTLSILTGVRQETSIAFFRTLPKLFGNNAANQCSNVAKPFLLRSTIRCFRNQMVSRTVELFLTPLGRRRRTCVRRGYDIRHPLIAVCCYVSARPS